MPLQQVFKADVMEATIWLPNEVKYENLNLLIFGLKITFKSRNSKKTLPSIYFKSHDRELCEI